MKKFYILAGMGLLVLGLLMLRVPKREYHDITLQYNGLGWSVHTDARDIAELLIKEMGQYENLEVTQDPETPLTDGFVVSVSDKSTVALAAAVDNNLKTALTPPTPAPPLPIPAPKPAPKPTPAPAPPQPKSPIYSGTATWYRHGDGLTVASRDFKIGTKLKVIAVKSGKSVEVTVTDYGPQASTGVALDLNVPAFEAIAPLGAGRVEVKYYKV